MVREEDPLLEPPPAGLAEGSSLSMINNQVIYLRDAFPLFWGFLLNRDAVEKWKSIRQEDLFERDTLGAAAHPSLDRWEQKHTWKSSYPPGSALKNPWLWLVRG